jgi:hypothetical protein
MATPWATNFLHFHLHKLFKKWFLIWDYFVWQKFWLLFKKLGDFFPNHLSIDPIGVYQNTTIIQTHTEREREKERER